MAHDLDRFVTAQADSYAAALAELRRGSKQGHWMWWIFPQLAGLGLSATSRFYAIADVAEARAYLAHPVLGPRLVEVSKAVAAAAGAAAAIMGPVDAMKLRSSMTLFASVAADAALFTAVLARFFAGERDPATLRLLTAQGNGAAAYSSGSGCAG